MPAIKTGLWLKEKRNHANMSVIEFAIKSKIEADTILKIEEGSNKGTGNIWDKILKTFEITSGLVSFDSEELIKEIKEDIAEFGANEPCWLFYKLHGDNIIFTNYDFIQEELPITPKEIGNENIMQSTLGESLELLEHQDRII